MAHKLFLLLGSNLGDSAKNIAEARDFIGRNIGDIITSSSLYLTASWGDPSQPDYVNQALILSTELEPGEVLDQCLSIETVMGRKRTEKWGARIIDIDILFFDERIVNQDALVIPHPRLPERKFALLPLQEIAPDFLHPVIQQTVSQLVNKCGDKLSVKKI